MRLKAWRALRGRTQQWVADATGIGQAALSKYERGVTPQISNARKIERATGGEVKVEDWYPPPDGTVAKSLLDDFEIKEIE